MQTKHQFRQVINPRSSTFNPLDKALITSAAVKDSLASKVEADAARGDHPAKSFFASTSKNESQFVVDLAPSAGSSLGYRIAKRTLDLIVGSVLLVIAAPVILLAAAIICIDSAGSPFFVQVRLGQRGEPFKMYKLRGMFRDAKERFPALYDYSGKKNLDFCFHNKEDPRVTRAGKFFRKTSIDELPNLWNVVRGDMSLVGPRPEIPDVLALYGPFRAEYLSVKPGVTCLSKCTGRDTLTKRETIEYDLDYVRNRGFAADARILWRTFCCVVLRRDVF